jgi:hypothetical protein
MPLPHTFGTQSGNVAASQLDDNFNALLLKAGWPLNTVLGSDGSGNIIGLTPAQLYTLIRGALPWEAAGFMGGVQGGGNWLILRYQPTTNVIINQGSCLASCGTVATASAVFNILDNGANIGTITFAAASPTGTVVITGSPYTLTHGHVLAVQAPLTPDTTLADVSFTFGGNRA